MHARVARSAPSLALGVAGCPVTFTDLAPGPHGVTVILVHSDHIAVQPPTTASVRFLVAR